MVRDLSLIRRNANATLRRGVLGCLVFACAAAATLELWRILAPGGLAWLNALSLVLFALLFTWICISFWTMTAGICVQIYGMLCHHPPKPTRAPDPPLGDQPRTALLMPICNEDIGAVFARVEAMHLSLRGIGMEDRFDIFILSDTLDPKTWIEEEMAWQTLSRKLPAPGRVFYRHRSSNAEFKSGNIAEFCRRWGRRYCYMIVLDADSLMSGATMVELVRRMERTPRAGLIQTVPMPVRGRTLFARLQQFAANLYGPAFATGAAFWHLGQSNYWGHNAIIRVGAFMQHCGLPRLPGRRPFGGQILSHDFVEAALLVRAGWEVRLAADLGQSYEEAPPTLPSYARRDYRWCQGNLQHLRPLFARGLHPMSRLHLAMGIMTYLAAPLWLLFVLVSAFDLWRRTHAPYVYFTADSFFPHWPISHALEAQVLLGATLALLYVPKIFSLILLCMDRERVAGFGGRLAAFGGVLVEAVFSALIAPVLMAFHTRFVVLTLVGRDTGWTPQSRVRRRARLGMIVRVHAEQVIGGLAGAVAAYHFVPELFWWLVPILAGPVLAIPLSLALSSRSLGSMARRCRLFLVPDESRPASILRVFQEVLERAKPLAIGNDPVDQVIRDPLVNALHAVLQSGTAVARPPDSVLQRAALGGLSSLSVQEQRDVLSDPVAVMWLHTLFRRASAALV